MAEEFDKNHIKNAVVVNIIANQKGGDIKIKSKDNFMQIPLNASWPDFNESTRAFIEKGDGVILMVDDSVELDNVRDGTNMSIKTNTLNKIAQEQDKHVLSQDKDKQWYLVNPTGDAESRKLEKNYSPSNEAVMAKFESFESEEKWQENQSKIWDKLRAMNGLNDGQYKFAPNHERDLMNPKRGLEKEDLKGFWSYRSFQTLNPAILKDNMVGMPGVRAKVRSDIKMTPSKGPNAGEVIDINPIILQSEVMNGYMIPMTNAQGFTAKHQIATDESVFNTKLKPRTADGTSIVKSEIEKDVRDKSGKKNTEYKFKIGDKDSHLKVVDVGLSEKNNITLEDINGQFKASMGEDIREKLVERGYDMPDIVDSLSLEKGAKYIWPGIGSMTGSNKEVQRTVSPSNAGFIVAREPKESNEKKDYVVVVTEGALKGHIVSKYLGKEGDKENPSVGDYLANDSGIIVAQVPGVSRAFVESVAPIYKEYNVKGTYIAMDADGRENKSVATGIKDSEEILSKHSRTKVMSWDPKQKGLDDALIAIDRGAISVKDLGITLGSASELFPLDKAQAPNPYRLDGSRAHDSNKGVRPEWQTEYSESNAKKQEQVRKAQQETEERNQKIAEKEQPEINIVSEDIVSEDIITESKDPITKENDVNRDLILKAHQKIEALKAESEEFNRKQAEKLENIGKELADLLPEYDSLEL